MTSKQIIDKYISFFENRGHVRIENSSLVPLNDPTTLFTSSGMQPLVPFLLGETHPSGSRLVNVQNCFRAQDIDEIGDNRHTTFFRMLGNWSLGDPASPKENTSLGGYFKKEQIPWLWEFLTSEEGLGLDKNRLHVTVFKGLPATPSKDSGLRGGRGDKDIPKDQESIDIWTDVLNKSGLDPNERISEYGVDKNWWSRSGPPANMPIGEPGGPDTEVFYEFSDIEHDPKFGEKCHVNCDCGRYFEIVNSVFMQYKKTKFGFEGLPQKNVDFGGGLERLIAATEGKSDIFETSLFLPIIKAIEKNTEKSYKENAQEMRIILDHFVSASFIISNGVKPSNKEQGYILRRLVRRGFDSFYRLDGEAIDPVIQSIASQYVDTDPEIKEKLENIKNTILEEKAVYKKAIKGAQKFVSKKYKHMGDELRGVTEISSEDAFILYSTHGLSPTQIESLGYNFDRRKFIEMMKEHQNVSRKGAGKKFAGGLADHEELTIKGHTATHLMHQALRDVLGDSVLQTGSNITNKRVRFDFSFDRKLTQEETEKVNDIVNKKIQESLPVFNTVMTIDEAKKLGAIGLFDDKYKDKVKIYVIGGSEEKLDGAYSKEFCGGPHVSNTSQIKSFAIIKEEGVSQGVRRIYAVVS